MGELMAALRLNRGKSAWHTTFTLVSLTALMQRDLRLEHRLLNRVDQMPIHTAHLPTPDGSVGTVSPLWSRDVFSKPILEGYCLGLSFVAGCAWWQVHLNQEIAELPERKCWFEIVPASWNCRNQLLAIATRRRGRSGGTDSR